MSKAVHPPPNRGNSNLALVVDADVAWAAITSVALQAWFHVEVVSSASEAFEIAIRAAPALIVIGVENAEPERIELIEVLRGRSPDCRILVVLPACTTRMGGCGRWAACADGLLRKPLVLQGLFAHVGALFPIDAGDHRVPRLGPHVGRAIEHIRDHYGERLSIESIAVAIGLSESRLAHVFHATMGIPVKDYVARIRTEVVKRILRSTDDTLESIAGVTGFCDASHLSRVFRQHTGESPGEYRRRIGVAWAGR